MRKFQNIHTAGVIDPTLLGPCTGDKNCSACAHFDELLSSNVAAEGKKLTPQQRKQNETIRRVKNHHKKIRKHHEKKKTTKKSFNSRTAHFHGVFHPIPDSPEELAKHIVSHHPEIWKDLTDTFHRDGIPEEQHYDTLLTQMHQYFNPASVYHLRRHQESTTSPLHGTHPHHHEEHLDQNYFGNIDSVLESMTPFESSSRVAMDREEFLGNWALKRDNPHIPDRDYLNMTPPELLGDTSLQLSIMNKMLSQHERAIKHHEENSRDNVGYAVERQRHRTALEHHNQASDTLCDLITNLRHGPLLQKNLDLYSWHSKQAWNYSSRLGYHGEMI